MLPHVVVARRLVQGVFASAYECAKDRPSERVGPANGDQGKGDGEEYRAQDVHPDSDPHTEPDSRSAAAYESSK